MILTCPNCSIRYLLNAQALMPEGRRVRCSACHHIWFEHPQEEAGTEKPQSFAAAMEEAEAIPEAVRPLPDNLLLALAEPEKKKGMSPQVSGYLAAAAVFLLLAGGLVLERAAVAALWPPSSLLFSTIGLDVLPPGTGLSFDHVKAVASLNQQGEHVLNIEGKLINLSAVQAAVPMIEAVINGDGGTERLSWTGEAPVKTLEPEKDAVFALSHVGLPDDAKAVTVRFVLGSPSKTVSEGGENTPAQAPDAEAHRSGGEEH